jgi:hypothetical protein
MAAAVDMRKPEGWVLSDVFHGPPAGLYNCGQT